MSLKRKFLNFFTAIVMVFGNVPFTFSNAYAAEPAGEAPKSSKTVKANGDGTYDITLEIEGKSSTSQTGGGANVVIVMDTSASMSEYFSWHNIVVDPNGALGKISKNVNSVKQDVYTNLYTGSCTSTNGKACTFTRISDGTSYKTNWGAGSIPTTTTKLFYNDAEATDGKVRNRDSQWNLYSGSDRYTSTTGQTAIESRSTRLEDAKEAINSLGSKLLAENTNVELKFFEFNKANGATQTYKSGQYDSFESYINDRVARYTTNWPTALENASKMSFSGTRAQDYPTYIIFVSDGNPEVSGKSQAELLSESKNIVKNILDDGRTFYAVGIFGDATSMVELGGIYYDATDIDALNASFDEIVEVITREFSVVDLKISDGITAATSTEVKGNPASFRYNVPESWGDNYEKAEFKDGSVIWNPGKDKTLSNGEKASVTFTVWPSQEAMNCIAEIKNGGNCSEADLEAFGLEKSGDSYKLKTNTTASFTYRTRTTTNGEVSDSLESTPQVMTEERDDTTLPETLLSVTKVWADGMQKSQRTDEYGNGVVLTLSVDGKDVEKFEFSGNEDGNEWENGYTYAVAPGVMKKLNGEDDPIRNIAEKLVTVNSETYAVLESGHDYVFSETPDSGHYELTKKSFHPMIVDDGKIHDVIFDGETATIESVEMTKLFAENTLNGGILVSKVVYNNGEKDLSIEDKFEIKISLSEESGTYRILTMNEDGSQDRGSKKDYTDGEIVEKISQNQQILVTDVPTGTTFEVSETLPEGYTNKIEYELIEYELIDYNTNESKKGVKEVFGNSSSTATVTNYLESGSLKISKTVVNENGDANAISGKTFTFNVLVNGANYKTVELKDGEDVTLDNIPAGAKYSVSEVNIPLGFKASETTLEGTIEKGKTAEADFSNTYSVEPTNQLKNLELRAAKGFDNFWNKLDEGEGFTFVLTDQQTGRTYDSEILNALNNNVATFNFANLGIKIDSFGTGEYKYIISEKTPTVKGVSRVEGDADIYVTVKVKDDGFGQLSLDSIRYAKGETAEGDATEKTINNTYDSILVEDTDGSDFEGKLTFEKVVENHENWDETPAEKETYFFSLYEGNTLIQKDIATDFTTHKFTFGPFEFTKEDAGTHTYTIKEQVEDSVLSHAEDVTNSLSFSIVVSYDETTKTLSAVVNEPTTREYKNNYKAEGEFGGDKKFVCSADGEICTNGLSFTKRIFDKDDNEYEVKDSYSFKLESLTEGAPALSKTNATTDANGKFSFGTIMFNETHIGKSFEYRLTETSSLPKNGVSNERMKEIRFVIEVLDGGQGTLKFKASRLDETGAKVPYTTSYENLYAAEPTPEDELSTELEAKFEKILIDKSNSYTDTEFTFEVSGEGHVLSATVTPKASEKYNDGKITVSGNKFEIEGLSFAKKGSYLFDVYEKLPELCTREACEKDGFTYDVKTYHMKVIVEDDLKGQLYIANIEIDGSDATKLSFTNIYEAEETDEDDLKKAFDGKILKKLIDESLSLSNETFEFTIDAGENGTASATATIAKDKATGEATVAAEISDGSTISFAKVGEYEITISEKDGGLDGMTYARSQTIKVTISDENGKLVFGEIEELTFTNVYKAESVTIGGETDTKLSVTKAVSGENLPNEAMEKTFTFVLEDATGEEIGRTTAKDGETKDFSAKLTFETEGTFSYTISELDEHEEGDGWTFDNNSERTLTVTVTTNKENGKLVAEVSGNNPTFTNTYSASATTPEEFIRAVQISKEIVDKSGSAKDGTFDFELIGTGDHAGETYSATITTENLEGTAHPTTGATFSKAGEYNFTVREIAGTTNGMTYDNSEKTITIVVVDDGTGKLSISEVKNNNPKFTNVYDVTPVTDENIDELVEELTIKKHVTDNSNLKIAPEETFTFEIKNLGSNETETVEITTNSEGTSTPNAEELKALLTKIGKYSFEIREVSGTTEGYDYDTTVYTVVIEVKDEDSQLVATVKISKDETTATEIKFENVFTATTFGGDDEENEYKDALKFEKVFSGRDWTEDDEFTFTISGSEGAPMPTETSGTATKDATEVSFGEIVFFKEHVGKTFTYTVSEETYGTETRVDGILRKTEDIEIKVTVSLEDEKIKLDVSDYAKEIENEYKSTGTIGGDEEDDDVHCPTSGCKDALTFTKILEGRDWKNDAFTFEITADDETAPLPEETTVTVTSEGEFKFGPITFDETHVGKTFNYIITEDDSEFDELLEATTKVLVVKVTVSDDLKGSLIFEIEKDEDTFINTYFEPGRGEVEEEVPYTFDGGVAGYYFLAILGILGTAVSVLSLKDRKNYAKITAHEQNVQR
ncbi:hypothetical protein IJ380_01680 [Candidatus Saccharibacteria bacterium]|nr:hypothetical protein [Candidatus Saccharibacteria bacterium]